MVTDSGFRSQGKFLVLRNLRVMHFSNSGQVRHLPTSLRATMTANPLAHSRFKALIEGELMSHIVADSRSNRPVDTECYVNVA